MAQALHLPDYEHPIVHARLHLPCRRVAEVEGLEQLYIDRRMAGLRGDAISDAQHGRFAAAVLLDRLVADISSMHALEQAWGKPSTLTKGGE